MVTTRRAEPSLHGASGPRQPLRGEGCIWFRGAGAGDIDRSTAGPPIHRCREVDLRAALSRGPVVLTHPRLEPWRQGQSLALVLSPRGVVMRDSIGPGVVRPETVLYAIADTHLGLREYRRPWTWYAYASLLGTVVALASVRWTSHWVLTGVVLVGLPAFALLAKKCGLPLANLLYLMGTSVLIIAYGFDSGLSEALERYRSNLLPMVILVAAGVLCLSQIVLFHRRDAPKTFLTGEWPAYFATALLLVPHVLGVVDLPTPLLLLAGLPVVASPYFHTRGDFETVRGEEPWRVDALHSDAPVELARFLQWLIGLGGSAEGGGAGILKVWPPTHLVLLGDILELWDAENPNVLLSGVPIANLLQQLKARKVYVLGNHDGLLRTLSGGSLPFGARGDIMEVIEDIYPAPKEGRVDPMPIGDRRFVFLHGHQFGRTSRHVLGWLRQMGAALGDWPLFLFLPLFFLAMHFALAGGSVAFWLLMIGSFVLWFPRYYMLSARLLYRGRGFRYMGKVRVLEGFGKRWKRAVGRYNITEPENLTVVFGHTHEYWFEPLPDESYPGRSGSSVGTPPLPRLLCNISSWVRLLNPKTGNQEFFPTILYSDSTGRLLTLKWQQGATEPVLLDDLTWSS